jgi:hypothetical protein
MCENGKKTGGSLPAWKLFILLQRLTPKLDGSIYQRHTRYHL